MARSLSFALGDQQFDCEIEKVDRAKLYGRVEKKAFDKSGNECYFGFISSDGMHIFGKESFEMGYQSQNGEWLERSNLKVLDMDDQALEKVPASFNDTIELSETVSVDTYLMHIAKSVYHLAATPELLQQVQANDEIYAFPFNYTASYQPDSAFLVENEGELFMVVGQHCGFEFLEMQTIDNTVLEEDDEDEDDDIDFSMF